MIERRKRRCTRLLLPLVALIGCGCRSAGPATGPSTRSILVADRSARGDALWEVTKDVLRGHGYRIDRVDRRAGVITTWPCTSQQVFEFWRNDVCTTADQWEATINPIRRWIEVRFTKDDAGAWRSVSVIAHKERFSSPDRQFNSTGAAYQVFGNQLPVAGGAANASPDDDRWLDVGRDRVMERCIAQRIMDRAGLTDVSAGAGVLTHPSP